MALTFATRLGITMYFKGECTPNITPSDHLPKPSEGSWTWNRTFLPCCPSLRSQVLYHSASIRSHPRTGLAVLVDLQLDAKHTPLAAQSDVYSYCVIGLYISAEIVWLWGSLWLIDCFLVLLCTCTVLRAGFVLYQSCLYPYCDAASEKSLRICLCTQQHSYRPLSAIKRR